MRGSISHARSQPGESTTARRNQTQVAGVTKARIAVATPAAIATTGTAQTNMINTWLQDGRRTAEAKGVSADAAEIRSRSVSFMSPPDLLARRRFAHKHLCG